VGGAQKDLTALGPLLIIIEKAGEVILINKIYQFLITFSYHFLLFYIDFIIFCFKIVVDF
jgi:hypothetical protein